MAIATPLAVLGMVTVSAPAAQAAAAVSGASARTTGGFPLWYQDNATTGTRLEPCFNGLDANCVLPAVGAEPGFDPRRPTVFPTNFPSEFFYAYAQSSNVATPGCNGTSPGRAFVTLALEGAFIGGAPKAGDQMTFGRIRVRVTSGLCPGRSYTFRHPFGQVVLTADAAGAIPVNTAGATVDVGCLAPSVTAPCDFGLATGSPVFGGTAGFLRWSGNPQPPVGYLGDGVTPHAITGANGANSVNAFQVVGPNANGVQTTLQTTSFVVAGKIAGPLVASPASVGFGTVDAGSTKTQTITVTNLNANRYRVNNTNPPATVTGPGAAAFQVQGSTCRNQNLVQDQTCTVTVVAAPTAAGTFTATVNVAYTGDALAARSPLTVPVTVTGVAGGAPAVAVTPNPVAFGSVRIRTSKVLTATVQNTGTASLGISAAQVTGAAAGLLTVTGGTCVGTAVAPQGTCTVDLLAAPAPGLATGAVNASLVLSSNVPGGTTTVPVTLTVTGGVAAVSPDLLPVDKFPTWYRDENGVKLSQCIDPTDPYCVVLPDATFTAGQPLSWLPTAPGKPLNFPGEFFYTVADSDLLATPGCQGTAPGSSAYRSAIEGTFVSGSPVDGEQMVFGRERFFVTSGLCPGATYTITTPYGQTTAVADASGGIKRAAATTDIGCVPAAPATCVWEEALGSPVAGGFLRWDPTVAPAAPAGYIGDAATFHRVIGAPYSEDGVTPSNYFKITGPGLAAPLQTNQFSVMGKLQGPLEATGAASGGTLTLPGTPVGSTSAATTLTVANTGISAVTVNALTVGGVDAAEFTTSADQCTGVSLAPGATCTVAVTFAPAATGARSATLTFANNGLNDPFVVTLVGVGIDQAGPAISFAPRSVAFGQLAVGRTSAAGTVTISNAGGAAPLNVGAVGLAGTNAADFSVVRNGCLAAVPVDQSCTVDVVFAPTSAGDKTATLTTGDDAAGAPHSLALTGTAFSGAPAVSAAVDRYGYPTYYQDGNGVRLQPCLDAQNCVLLGVPHPDQPLSVPGNFPNEFFYALADSELVTVPGCNGAADGTALLRLGLEGSFATGSPVTGDQTTFTRIRITASGLCPNVGLNGAPGYTAVTPYGTFTFATDANGAVRPNASTQDTGCGAAPCAFNAALATPGATFLASQTPIAGFLRWDPNVATPPAGFLGDATSFKKVVGGTYVKPGTSSAFNGFEIRDPAGNLVTSTERWLVAGKLAGLQPSTATVDFGNVDTGAAGTTQTVTVTNDGASTDVTPTLAGAGAAQFAITGGTCATGTPVAQGATCTVDLQFRPTLTGPASASLVLTPATGPAATVSLTGVGNATAAPNITVTPGVLSYGTVTAPASAALTTTITNTGTAPLDVTGLATAPAGDFARTLGGSCLGTSFTLAPGAHCTVEVTFTPTAVGARTGALAISHDAAGGTTSVALTGTGAAATLSIPASVAFGTINRNSAKTQTVSVRNNGTANATLTAATTTITGSPTFTVVTATTQSTCFAAALAPGRSCNLVVQFLPTAVGTVTGTLQIGTAGTALPGAYTVALSGTGK